MPAAEVAPVPAVGLPAAPAASRHPAAAPGPVLEDRGGSGLHGQERVPGRRAACPARRGLDPAATASSKEHASEVAATRATPRSTPAGPPIGAKAGCAAAATLRGHGQPPPRAHRSEERTGGSARPPRQGVKAGDTLAADGLPGPYAGAADPLGRGTGCGVPACAGFAVRFHAGAGWYVPSPAQTRRNDAVSCAIVLRGMVAAPPSRAARGPSAASTPISRRGRLVGAREGSRGSAHG